jgi:hypothetical protein
MQGKKTASGCCSVCVCVCPSLHAQMLRVFFAFPSFLHRVAHHHHIKWDNLCYQRQQKHSYQSLEKMAQKEFSSSSNKWVQEQQFLFCRKLPKQHAIQHEETQPKKKFFIVC